MLLEVLGHAEALLTLLAEDGLHDLVGGEPLTVLLVLSIEVYTITPTPKFITWRSFSLRYAHNFFTT